MCVWAGGGVQVQMLDLNIKLMTQRTGSQQEQHLVGVARFGVT